MSLDRAFVALLRALIPHLGACRLLASTSRDWASATFEGAHHRLAVALEGEDGAARAARLQLELRETDLAMVGSFVADIHIVLVAADAGVVIAIEALTIVEAELASPTACPAPTRRETKPIRSC